VSRRKIYSVGAAVLAVLSSVSCVFFENPSRRTALEYVRPDGTRVQCYEPPPDVVPEAVKAEVEAKLPELIELLNARVGLEQTFERVRAACPDLRAVEAVEFRLCVAWAQRVLETEAYGEFLREVLPRVWGEAREGASPLGRG